MNTCIYIYIGIYRHCITEYTHIGIQMDIYIYKYIIL